MDWAKSALGPIDQWPAELRILVQTTLAAPVPAALLWGPQGILVYNDGYAAVCGPRHPEALGQSALEVWPEAREFNEQVIAAGLEGTALRFERQELELWRHGVAERVWMDLEYTPVRDGSGAPAGVLSFVFDVTEQVMAEARLSESEALFRFLYDVGQAVATVGDADEILAITTRMVGEHLGISSCAYADMDDDEDGFTIRGDWAAPGSQSIVGHYSLAAFGQKALVELHAGRPLIVNDNAIELAPHEAKTFQDIGIAATICMPLVVEGRLKALMAIHDRRPRTWSDHDLAVIREITNRSWAHVERVRSEARTRESMAALAELNHTLEERVARALAERKTFGDIVDGSGAAVTALGPDWRILAINRVNIDAFERIYGRRPAVGDHFLSLFDDRPEDRAQQEAIWSRALAGETFHVVEQFGDSARDRRYYEVRFDPLLDKDGERIGAASTSYDVTDRIAAERRLEAAEEQLRASQKMEAMGQLTGGVAHDFNNLLAPILGGLDMLRREEVGTARHQKLIAGAIQSAERARVLVQRLLAFARRQPLQAQGVDLSALVTNMRELLTTTLGPQIALDTKVEQGLPSAHADPNQLEMALLNLAVNSRDAMPEGGTLTLTAAVDELGADNAAALDAATYVRLTVSDTGQGMPADIVAKAVEPFFSTKGIGKGTGLGLSMVHGLARQLGGGLAIDSAPGAGTSVHLWLPLSEEQPRSAMGAAPAIAEGVHSGLVLLVDDEELVRLSTADMLGELGYEVVEAGSAEQALEEVQRGLTPDLLVSDHLMPGMSGVHLARALRADRADLKVLIVSGYAETEGLAPEFARLEKPFRKDELSARLAALP
ncbi:PAS domain-containing protein [Sphingomonas sabuli]|uniref:histidine kinase n=2 Tax=Sphingomonas sabuli TaxID=2764186 RepID=A0A7G9L639_9SPHN|nr:PAS domain-containing protein [Sphingomonas sabuli]